MRIHLCLRRFLLRGFYFLNHFERKIFYIINEKPNYKQRWFSGRILACHAGGPGSIPGRCILFKFTCYYEGKLDKNRK